MRREYLRIVGIVVYSVFLTIGLGVVANVSTQPARADVSFDLYYSQLSPHGSWYVSSRYGRVWQPRVYHRGWNPYYDGHWVYSDVGWTWVSDYAWGEIPYHYGTWVLDAELGWVWVPGYVWAPSWVVFREGSDCIGWAPVSPGFTVGLSVESGGYAPGSFVFVSSRDFVAPRIRSCVLPESRARIVVRNTRIVNRFEVDHNLVVNRGLDVNIVEKARGRRIHAVPIEHVARVAPGPRVSRIDLGVEPARIRGGLRASEPISRGDWDRAARHERARLPDARPQNPSIARPEEGRRISRGQAGPRAMKPARGAPNLRYADGKDKKAKPERPRKDRHDR